VANLSPCLRFQRCVLENELQIAVCVRGESEASFFLPTPQGSVSEKRHNNAAAASSPLHSTRMMMVASAGTAAPPLPVPSMIGGGLMSHHALRSMTTRALRSSGKNRLSSSVRVLRV
jgi:hypothetical protein